MNEQFKQIALKSGIVYLSEQTAHFKANDGLTVSNSTLRLTVIPSVDSLDKFAELIVRECICQCDDENSQKYIMSHFGFTEKDWS